MTAATKISSTSGGFGGGLSNGDNFSGRHVCTIGDVDGDGMADLAVGALRDDDGGPDRGAVWILFLDNLPDLPTSYGAGCAGATIHWAGPPPAVGAFGGSVVLEGAAPGSPGLLLMGASDAAWGAVPLPLDLGNLGAVGCSVLASPDIVVPGGPADSNGSLALPVSVPPDPHLVGATVYVQWAVIDPAANPLGLVPSDGLAALVHP
mgnify:CR=1 FL=1